MSPIPGDSEDLDRASREELRATVRLLRATLARHEETIARQARAIAALQGRSRPAALADDPPETTYTIIFDGGAIGNPGKGYGSYQIQTDDRVLYRLPVDFGERMTNNQAEYRTLIHALEHLRRLLGDQAKLATVEIRGDSQLVLNQISGAWKVKNADLRPLHQRAVELLRGFAGFEAVWQPRLASVELFGH